MDPVPGFVALGDPTRLALVRRLSDGRPRSIRSLSDETTMSRQAVTKHLGVLRAAGLVQSEKKGRETHFTFQRDALIELRDYLDTVARQWDSTLGRLKALVEE